MFQHIIAYYQNLANIATNREDKARYQAKADFRLQLQQMVHSKKN